MYKDTTQLGTPYPSPRPRVAVESSAHLWQKAAVRRCCCFTAPQTLRKRTDTLENKNENPKKMTTTDQILPPAVLTKPIYFACQKRRKTCKCTKGHPTRRSINVNFFRPELPVCVSAGLSRKTFCRPSPPSTHARQSSFVRIQSAPGQPSTLGKFLTSSQAHKAQHTELEHTVQRISEHMSRCRAQGGAWHRRARQSTHAPP